VCHRERDRRERDKVNGERERRMERGKEKREGGKREREREGEKDANIYCTYPVLPPHQCHNVVGQRGKGNRKSFRSYYLFIFSFLPSFPTVETSVTEWFYEYIRLTQWQSRRSFSYVVRIRDSYLYTYYY
jgi:hypothetical protein